MRGREYFQLAHDKKRLPIIGERGKLTCCVHCLTPCRQLLCVSSPAPLGHIQVLENVRWSEDSYMVAYELMYVSVLHVGAYFPSPWPSFCGHPV